MGRGVFAIDAGLFARGHGVPAAGHPHVLGLVLLGVSRQGPRRPGISLTTLARERPLKIASKCIYTQCLVLHRRRRQATRKPPCSPLKLWNPDSQMALRPKTRYV